MYRIVINPLTGKWIIQLSSWVPFWWRTLQATDENTSATIPAAFTTYANAVDYVAKRGIDQAYGRMATPLEQHRNSWPNVQVTR